MFPLWSSQLPTYLAFHSNETTRARNLTSAPFSTDHKYINTMNGESQEATPLNLAQAESGLSSSPGGSGYGGVVEDEEGGSERSNSTLSLSNHKGTTTVYIYGRHHLRVHIFMTF